MKARIKNILLALVLCHFGLIAQDSLRKPLTVAIQYYSIDHGNVYLMVNAKTKVKGRFRPVQAIQIKTFLDEESMDKLMDSATTDESGRVKIALPSRLKDQWMNGNAHTFIATAQGNDSLKATQGELTIKKAKIIVDTLSDESAKSIKITALELNGKDWVPIKGLEVKPGVARLGGSLLKITEADTYTTDSSGSFIAAIKDSIIPGDDKGNIMLTAKIEENENFGNLTSGKIVPWGKVTPLDKSFFEKRTLWSTRFRTPYWLLVIVYGMSIGIWGTIFVVIRDLIRTIKMGKN